jgi:cell wall assembly regulator SMI1
MTDLFPLHAFASASKGNPSNRFAPPASDEAVASFVASIGLEVPEAFLAFHRLHDGTARPVQDATGEVSGEGRLFVDFRWLSLHDLVRSKQTWDATARAAEGDPVALAGPAGYWHPTWLPFLQSDDLVGALCTAPCFGRPAGQVVFFDWRSDDGWTIEFPDFGSFVEAVAGALNDGSIDRPQERTRGREVRVPLPELASISTRFEQVAPELRPVPTFAPGDAVRVLAGSMQDRDAVVLREVSPGHYVVRADVFGRGVEVEAMGWDLERR